MSSFSKHIIDYSYAVPCAVCNVTTTGLSFNTAFKMRIAPAAPSLLEEFYPILGLEKTTACYQLRCTTVVLELLTLSDQTKALLLVQTKKTEGTFRPLATFEVRQVEVYHIKKSSSYIVELVDNDAKALRDPRDRDLLTTVSCCTLVSSAWISPSVSI